MRVGVIGTGYVGLVTGACLSELGHDVVCVDTDAMKIARLRNGEIPIYEPGLDKLVAENAERGKLRFTTAIDEAVAGGVDVLFIAVGTPSDGNGAADLGYVFAAVEQAARAIAAQKASEHSFTVLVTKSTVPVGTSRRVAALAGAHLSAERFAVASNPEFLREGNAIADFMEPDRIVVGSHSERARKLLEELYMPLTRKGRPLVVTSTVETAELVKYAANAFLATKVTFINEIARLCELAGADIKELALGVGLDSRIGPQFFAAGPGFGGSCFPKDLRALVKTARDFGSPVEIIETVIRANDHHKAMMVEKLRNALGGSLAGRHIGVLGLAFKANTDDMRDAPALTIVPQLVAEGATVKAYDPQAAHQARQFLPDLTLADTAAAALKGADAALIVTEWAEFRTLAWPKLAKTMRHPLVVDLRNIYEAADMTRHGMEYISLGRQEADQAYRAAAE
ncbi:MAG TPA: UDP-glucose/GDP-mannose dehydrogenase family protein [Propylenella sp.]|nr:UDP-glucose/GDP-mannose dehydrogenase family protein [Propylenella sp.]